MTRLLVISGALVGLTLTLLVQLQAQQQIRTIPAGNTPLVAENLVNDPVPKLADGTVDLTGPWQGGGSNADIEREGGLTPGELPLLPWAKALRDKRKERDEPYVACLPMSVPRMNPFPWKFAMSYTSEGLTHIYVLHELAMPARIGWTTWMAASTRAISSRRGCSGRAGGETACCRVTRWSEGYLGLVVETRGALSKIAKAATPDKPLFIQGGPEAPGFPGR